MCWWLRVEKGWGNRIANISTGSVGATEHTPSTLGQIITSVASLSQHSLDLLLVRIAETSLRSIASSMATEPLQNLTEQSAGVGTWLLSVVNVPRSVEYTWTKGSSSGTSKKLECLLVSEDSTQYCLGRYTRKGKEPVASQNFKAAEAKFKKGSVWKVKKITLVKTNTQYIACSHKVVIDMNMSNFQPVLQSTVPMPIQATPPEDLFSLLQCPPGQLVDVIALVAGVSKAEQKVTQHGIRDLVNVTIMDDSGENGAAQSEFPAWFPKTFTGAPHEDLAQLVVALQDKVPVAFFNLVCQKDGGKTILKTSKDNFAFQTVRIGAKAERLASKADTLLSTETSQVTVVAELPVYESKEVDYLSADATFTVCRLLHFARISGSSSAADVADTGNSVDGAAEHATPGDSGAEHATPVFQMNHVRILEPKGGQNVYTNKGDRLWPNLRLIDSTGSVELRMREKAALAISGATDAKTFENLAAKGALNFPILCSVRVSMRKATRNQDSAGDEIDAVIVEAAEQDLFCPRALPNASMNYLSELLHAVAPDPSRMVAAPMSAVRHVSHSGMVVDSIKASCVLSLTAHVGRSDIVDLDGGHKVVSKGCWNVPFDEPESRDADAPEHADTKILGEVASYCTMENVQDYTLTGRRASEPVYALLLISSVRAAAEGGGAYNYMVDKVHPLTKAEVGEVRPLLRRLARFAKTSSGTAGIQSPPQWTPGRTPWTARKTRRLGYNPTASPLASPQKTRIEATEPGKED